MTNSFLRPLAITLVMVASLSACHHVDPIYNVTADPIPGNVQSKLSLTQVEMIITDAATAKNWQVKKIKSGELRGTIKWRDFSAVSTILYSKENYSINLVSSQNLDEKDGKIHHKYNEYVKQLQTEIDTRLAQAGH